MLKIMVLIIHPLSNFIYTQITDVIDTKLQNIKVYHTSLITFSDDVHFLCVSIKVVCQMDNDEVSYIHA